MRVPFQVTNNITKKKVFWNGGGIFQMTPIQPHLSFRNVFYKNF